jgi:hypothetical protein
MLTPVRIIFECLTLGRKRIILIFWKKQEKFWKDEPKNFLEKNTREVKRIKPRVAKDTRKPNWS